MPIGTLIATSKGLLLSGLSTTIKSSLVKQLIIFGFKMLLKHKTDGVTKEFLSGVLDIAAESNMNNATVEDVEALKKVL